MYTHFRMDNMLFRSSYSQRQCQCQCVYVDVGFYIFARSDTYDRLLFVGKLVAPNTHTYKQIHAQLPVKHTSNFGIFVPQNLSDLHQKCQILEHSKCVCGYAKHFHEVSQLTASFKLLLLLSSFCVQFTARILVIRLFHCISYPEFCYTKRILECIKNLLICCIHLVHSD